MDISDDDRLAEFIDHQKMKIMREVAKKMPNSNLVYIIKCIDETWDKEMKKLKPPKKKSAFVTKF